MKIMRRSFFILLLLLIAGLSKSQGVAPLVKTTKGYVSGLTENGIIVFKGIPYAAPPIGALRFKTTQEHAAWSDTLAATQFGSIASQVSGGTEDCLTLNLYTPKADNAKRPVLVWMHGGSMTSGSGKGQDGHAFADRDDIVTVTINYRLGVFGFTYLDDVSSVYAGSSNNGVSDCIMVLKWIKQNIEKFGGDPNRVTIMGESAGAKLVSAVMVSSASKGLFQQYIAESGSVQCVRDIKTAKTVRSRLLKILNLGENDAAKLLTLPTTELIKAQAELGKGAAGLLFLGPVADHVVITDENPYHYAESRKLPPVKVLLGTNATEATLFMNSWPELKDPAEKDLQVMFADNGPLVYKTYAKEREKLPPYEAATKVLTNYMYTMHTYRWASALVKADVLVYMYRFDFSSDPLGAAHARELPYVWFDPNSKAMADPTKRQLGTDMHKAWVAFIKTGNPSTQTLKWPAYDNKMHQIAVFNNKNDIRNLTGIFDDKDFPSSIMVFK